MNSSINNSWAHDIQNGSRLAIARAITEAENNSTNSLQIMREIFPLLGKAYVVGITGAPGAGKSTLVNALIEIFRKQEMSVGVVAIDPSSTFSGGAVLGDRIRMNTHTSDPEVFIRSLASRGHLGGLSESTCRTIDILDASGKDIIIIETVGTGQSEIEIAEVADAKIVVCSPGLGDDIQAIKSGILEIADILVVNKCDLPYAERTVSDLKQMLMLRCKENQDVPIFKTNAIETDTVKKLGNTIIQRSKNHTLQEERGLSRMRRQLLSATQKHLLNSLSSLSEKQLNSISNRQLKAEISMEQAIREILCLLI
ncbi:MAG: methylmalonyl Co-A mutase-associated GTPase MeaB [Gammaproteobacteria bacterium]|nr:MAG: methylmalonyl Co-A mutase-associated GTPase MeaB [Gammaproteobacteria bacterium]